MLSRSRIASPVNEREWQSENPGLDLLDPIGYPGDTLEWSGLAGGHPITIRADLGPDDRGSLLVSWRGRAWESNFGRSLDRRKLYQESQALVDHLNNGGIPETRENSQGHPAFRSSRGKKSGSGASWGSEVYEKAGGSVLYEQIQRVAAEHPETRVHLVPLLRKFACNCEDGGGLVGGRTWGNPDPRSTPDDNVPYRHHEKSPPAGQDGSSQRKIYNEWYRHNVCPDNHKTNCGAPWLRRKAAEALTEDDLWLSSSGTKLAE